MAQPHSRLLRENRYSEQGRAYHVRTSTHLRQPLFADLFLGRILVREMCFLHERGDVQSLAFVVMPDHLHWLFVLGDQPLKGVMQTLKGRSARAINLGRGQQGMTVWQPGYFDRAIRDEEQLKGVARYIVANPLRAKLCERLADYPLWDAIWVTDHGRG